MISIFQNLLYFSRFQLFNNFGKISSYEKLERLAVGCQENSPPRKNPGKGSGLDLGSGVFFPGSPLEPVIVRDLIAKLRFS